MGENILFMPSHILRNPSISPIGKVVYMVLRSYTVETDYCSPKICELCAVVGATAKPINRAIDELIDHKLVKRKQIGLGKPNCYTLLPIYREGFNGN